MKTAVRLHIDKCTPMCVWPYLGSRNLQTSRPARARVACTRSGCAHRMKLALSVWLAPPRSLPHLPRHLSHLVTACRRQEAAARACGHRSEEDERSGLAQPRDQDGEREAARRRRRAEHHESSAHLARTQRVRAEAGGRRAAGAAHEDEDEPYHLRGVDALAKQHDREHGVGED
eukprot:557160-Prymnesium_polylepis.2